jgi:signal transduction histidine kinase/ActR/RegA family two-component response regulator
MSTLGNIMAYGGIGLVVGMAAGLAIARLRRRRRRDDQTDSASLHKQLQRAQRMEALGILSGSIMHNLNNLLAVVLGQARLAREDMPPGSSAWNSLGQVIQAGEAAAELSREVDSYQSESDQDRSPTRLQPVVRSTVKLLRDILPDTVTIETELDPACGSVLASTTQVQQVLMSLCSNAYHAMYRRHGRIAVTMKPIEIQTPRQAIPRSLEPGVYVQLTVADNGRGMDDATLKHIFEPYFSARSPRRGAGLGLTMVSRLLAANEGVTIPSSLPGHGTRFDLYFPIIARGVQSTPTAEQAPPHLHVVESTGDGTNGDSYEAPAVAVLSEAPRSVPDRAHILLVEDDNMVAETVRSCLARAGFQVTVHDDGAAAVSAFAEDPGAFDLLLTDQFMRGLDGGEVVAEIRRYRPRMPVILMSGHPEGIRQEEVARLQISGAIAKPFTPTALLDLVKKALAGDLRAREGKG